MNNSTRRRRLWLAVITAAIATAAVAAPLGATSTSATTTHTYGTGTPSHPGTSYSKLKVSKTAIAKFDRSYDWTVTKQAAPASITTPANTATFSYTVTATKSAPTDSNFTVTGVITVTNPGKKAVSGVTVTDAVIGGPTCAVQSGVGLTVPADGSVTAKYTCTLTSKTDGTNRATAKWCGGSAATDVPFAFGEPTSVANDAVDVADSFNGEPSTLLPGGRGITKSTVFTYERTVAVPATGCTVHPNVATITSPQEFSRQASAMVEACRTPPPPVVIPTPIVSGTGATPPASLSVTKRGPRIARAGTVVTYTIAVRNTHASNPATSVVLSDIMPLGYSVFRRPSGATFHKGRLMWNLGTLAAGATKTVRVQIRLDRSTAGTRCNTGVASAGNASTVRSRVCTKILRVLGAGRLPIVTG